MTSSVHLHSTEAAEHQALVDSEARASVDSADLLTFSIPSLAAVLQGVADPREEVT